MAPIADNVARVRERIAAAALRSGREPDAVELLAAVKYLDPARLPELAQAGVTVVGENRAQELVQKATAHAGLFRWHFIGQLQSRKVGQIVDHVELIHSVASESALRQLERHARPDTRILVEVNLAGEESKAGIAPEDLPRYLELSPVPVLGLMTMPPFAPDAEASRPYFRRLRRLAEGLGLEELSMGTSQDYEVAIEEGATIVRVGAVLYG